MGETLGKESGQRHASPQRRHHNPYVGRELRRLGYQTGGKSKGQQDDRPPPVCGDPAGEPSRQPDDRRTESNGSEESDTEVPVREKPTVPKFPSLPVE